jgi:hypothetical protein
MSKFRLPGAVISFAFLGGVLAGCGGGGSAASSNVPHPLVRQFSPSMSPIDFNTGQANPTFTDGNLNVSTDPAYPGEIVVFFQTDTAIDPASVFVGGNPTLGIDYSAFQVLQYIPGTGNVPLPYSQVIVENDKIRFIPATLPLPNGQYSVGVFANLKSTEGDPVDKAPVFHSFTVGATDTIAPVVVVTSPVNNAQGVGAGVAPPPPPSGAPSSSIADVRTAIFGPTSPDILIRFSESIAASTVNTSTITAVDASAFVPGGGAPPAIAPAPGFPKLRSQFDHSSLPSNGFEVIWRADPTLGGLPFGSQVQVTAVGSDGGANGAPIRDRSDNPLLVSYQFQFQTVAPPLLPEGSEPEFSVYYSTPDRIGIVDSINEHEGGLVFIGAQTIPVLPNVRVPYSDTISTKATLGSRFDPQEISVDARLSGNTGHSYLYVQSPASGQIVIVNTRTMLAVALINTPTPGGVSNQTGGGAAANVLTVTNSSANTYTVFNIAGIVPGEPFLTNPITIQQVSPTGNTPKAISITCVSTGATNRSAGAGGPTVPLIMYADFTDGVVNTANLGKTTPLKQFALGTGASPNDVSLTPCFPGGLMYAAISEGGAAGEGKIAYYVAGPGCRSGIASGAFPDAIVGDLSGFDAPAGLDEIVTATFAPVLFAVAESGSTANRVVTLGLAGAGQFPAIVTTLDTGANPVTVAHVTAFLPPNPNGFICAPPGSPGCPFIPYLTYAGTTQAAVVFDPALSPSRWLYVCSRGAGRIDVIDMVTGARPITPDRTPPAPPADRISIPGVRGAYTTNSQ